MIHLSISLLDESKFLSCIQVQVLDVTPISSELVFTRISALYNHEQNGTLLQSVSSYVAAVYFDSAAVFYNNVLPINVLVYGHINVKVSWLIVRNQAQEQVFLFNFIDF